ncbi:MAG TPA: HRDC domain-containing protein [Steroidobacteraceae bacterium]|nr:HRDC domain-containing protein [Steroidobacteraceae bacterium]
MTEAIWIDRSDELAALARVLEAQTSIGVDTEFLRERTFFPKLCLLQLSAAGQIWCVDTLRVGSLEPLMPSLTAAHARKLIHAARQDLEAVYLTAKRVVSPVFDTQIAAACIGLKPQVGYADLVKTLLNVIIPKGQTRTDWSMRPLTRAQLEYAADDVLHLEAIAIELTGRLRALGREHWVREDCLGLEDRRLYEPEAAFAWARLRGVSQLPPAPRARAKVIAMWRESAARERNLPRAWILSDAAIFSIAEANPATAADLDSVQPLNEKLAGTLLAALNTSSRTELTDLEPSQESRPTPAQKALFDRLIQAVDARAAELQVSPEILAPRGELKALAMGKRDSHALEGWRLEEIGTRLLTLIGN